MHWKAMANILKMIGQKWCPLCKKQIFCTLQNEQENTNISFIEGWKLKISTSVKKAMENEKAMETP